MPEVGLVPGAAAERSSPVPWRARAPDLLANPLSRYSLGLVALVVMYRGVAQIGYELQFDLTSPTHMVLMLHTHPDRAHEAHQALAKNGRAEPGRDVDAIDSPAPG